MCNYICPNCGHHAEYSDQMAEDIIQVVCDYFKIQREDLGRTASILPKKSRQYAAYFIRKVTGIEYKRISYYMNIGKTLAGSYVAEIAVRMDMPMTKRYLREIEPLVLEKIKEKKYLEVV